MRNFLREIMIVENPDYLDKEVKDVIKAVYRCYNFILPEEVKNEYLVTVGGSPITRDDFYKNVLDPIGQKRGCRISSFLVNGNKIIFF